MTVAMRRGVRATGARAILVGALLGGLLTSLLGPTAAVAEQARSATLGPTPIAAATLGVGAATSTVLVEGATGQVLVAGDADTPRPIASAVKLVTALTVVEALPAGTLVTIGEEVRGVEGSRYDLRPGEVRSVDDLLAGLLLRSGNDAAVALAVAVAGSEEAFVARMQQVLWGLGVDARPGSASGLEPEDALSAADLATVARAALAEPRIRTLVGATSVVLEDGRAVQNRNLFLADTEGATGLKTGYTSLAGFTLAASARRDGRELVAVVLGASDDAQRREIAVRLLEHGFRTTERTSVARALSLRTTSGPVLFSTVPTTVTVPSGTAVAVVWPRSLHPEDTLASVELVAGGTPIAEVGVERLDGRRSDGPLGLGSALADGVYAALRPVVLAGGGPEALR